MTGKGSYHHVIESGIGNQTVQFVVDNENSKIFWADTDAYSIMETNFEGTETKVFLHNITDLNSVALIGEEMFWSLKMGIKLFWKNRRNLEFVVKQTVPEIPLGLMYDYNMVLLSTQPLMNVPHSCKGMNKCSHICVSKGVSRYECLCPTGMIFENNDNSTCVDPNKCQFRYVQLVF